MSDETQAKLLMAELKAHIKSLISILNADENLKFVGFEIEPVKLDDEESVLANGRSRISVKKLSDWQHRLKVLHYLGSFYSSDGHSTRFVSHMPGLIVSSLPPEVVICLIEQINKTKSDLHELVAGKHLKPKPLRNHKERHEFIHNAFPAIMTEQVYRKIPYTTRKVRSVWFNWIYKRQVNKVYDKDGAIAWLQKQIDRPKGLFIQEDWKAKIKSVIRDIEIGGFKSIQREREYRTFPELAYSYYDDDKRKTATINATMPWIMLGQATNSLPGGTDLGDFDRATVKISGVPRGSTIEPLFSALKLVGVR